MFNRWESRMHAEYKIFERCEGASRYLTCYGVICSSKQLRKQLKRCKCQTINEITALVERDHIISGTDYNMDDNKNDINLSGKAQCYDDSFHCK